MPSKSEKELLDSKLAANEKMMREITSSIKVIESDIASLNKILGALSEPVCPISEKLVCSTDKTGIRSELEGQVSAKEKLLVEQKDKLAGLVEEKNGLSASAEDFKKRETDYKTKLLYKEQLEKEKSVVIAEPPKPNTSTLAVLRLRSASLREELDLIQKYNTAEAAKKKFELLTKQVGIYEELVDQLSPKGGVRQKVLEHSVAPLQSYCNDKMKSVCPKYDLVLDTSDGFKVFLADIATGETISYASASTGERVRIIYVLMSMFNALNGFRILILDNLNELDYEACMLLMGLVKEDIEDYDHIFLASKDGEICEIADDLEIKYLDVFKVI